MRTYRRRGRERTARPGVVIEEGWAVELQSDPRAAAAQARLAELGPEVRDSLGRILWGTVADPRLRALRAYDGAADSRPVRIARGLVSDAGVIDEKLIARFDAPLQAKLRELVASNFTDVQRAA